MLQFQRDDSFYWLLKGCGNWKWISVYILTTLMNHRNHYLKNLFDICTWKIKYFDILFNVCPWFRRFSRLWCSRVQDFFIVQTSKNFLEHYSILLFITSLSSLPQSIIQVMLHCHSVNYLVSKLINCSA